MNNKVGISPRETSFKLDVSALFYLRDIPNTLLGKSSAFIIAIRQRGLEKSILKFVWENFALIFEMRNEGSSLLLFYYPSFRWRGPKTFVGNPHRFWSRDDLR